MQRVLVGCEIGGSRPPGRSQWIVVRDIKCSGLSGTSRRMHSTTSSSSSPTSVPGSAYQTSTAVQYWWTTLVVVYPEV
eukprot:3330520-Rhodomonas_salina.3